MSDRVSKAEFDDRYLVKNGQIGTADILNKAVVEVKRELDRLWVWATENDEIDLPSGSISTSLIDDVSAPNATGSLEKTRSARFIGLMINDDFTLGNSSSTPDNNAPTQYMWSASFTKANILDAVTEGGIWSNGTPQDEEGV